MPNWKESAMRYCIKLASKGKSFVQSNPMVGAVLLSKEGKILCEGYHKGFALKHAEVVALEQIERAPEHSCLFVNLEPCCHQGKNPPCSEIIIQKKVPKVIIGMLDPNPMVAGGGVSRLKEKAIDVEIGVCQKECELLNQKYLTHIIQKRPFVALKIASSLDGKIALQNQKSQWITGAQARARTHILRSEFEAIAVGKKTFLLENPKLNNRKSIFLPQPSPVIFWSQGKLPKDYFFFQDNRKKFLMVGKDTSQTELQKIQKKNIVVFQSSFSQPQPQEVLEFLYQQKFFSLLIEGGGALFTSFLQAQLVDKIFLLLAPKIIGGDGKNWCGALNSIELPLNNEWKIKKTVKLGEDILLEIYPQKLHTI